MSGRLLLNRTLRILREMHDRTHPARLFRLPNAPRPPATERQDEDDDDHTGEPRFPVLVLV